MKTYAYGCDIGPSSIWSSGIHREIFVPDIIDPNKLHSNSGQTMGCFSTVLGNTSIECAKK